MRFSKAWIILLLSGASILQQIDGRRVQIQRPLPEDEDEQETVNYYAAEPQDSQGSVVLVSSADRYNGLYGQQSATSRRIENDYNSRAPARTQETRVKETPKTPPVQTIRNYNKVNDDGSFTFGYEAADGSFKEETRGTDCVVRGKYGYVDPDGNKREFTYVSGNPCDPNAPKDQDEQDESNETENENVPANYPTRPIQPLRRPAAPKPAVTLFQNTYAQEEEQPEPEQLLRPSSQQPIQRPTYVSTPHYLQQTPADQEYQVYKKPQHLSTTTPASIIYRSSVRPVTITPRPITHSSSSRAPQLPATTYRPQVYQVSVTPRPTPLLYNTQSQSLASSTNSPDRNLGFEQEFQRFQQENNILSSTSTPIVNEVTTPRPKTLQTPGQVYSTALVYDPASGQYNNQIYQTLPQSDGDFVLKQKIQPYVQRPRPQVLNIQQLQQQSPLYSQNLRPQPVNSQAAYQAQQAELQFQNSAQLYAQQQRTRAEQEQQKQQAIQQPVYYIQPSASNIGALGSSQIDAFLRGHNIQF
nr:ras-interacting protein RIP3-like isoform X1 [Leptinotarsa decemlineata]